MELNYKIKVVMRKDQALFKVLCLAFLIMWWPKNLLAQAQFTPDTTNIPMFYNASAVWGDYDNDNDLDVLIVGGSTNYTSAVYRNDNGAFTDIGAGLTGVDYGTAAWGDYDNDGDLDILICGDNWMLGFISRIYRNDNGLFTNINAGLDGIKNGQVAWGDYDNDGDLDILMIGSHGVSKIYRNDAGLFTDINANLEKLQYCSVAWGDYDKDGDLDILVSGSAYINLGYSITWVYRNDNGTFVKINTSMPGLSFASVTWGDYDNDGDLDILLAGGYGNVLTRIYRNNNGVFTDLMAGLAGVDVGSVAWGDYDNDGDLDILLSGSSGGGNEISKVYRNDNGVFTDIVAGLAGARYSSAIWGDYDNDGDLDILIAGQPGNQTKVYINNNTIANTAPNAISGLISTTTQPNKVTLRWNKASDGQTPKNGLSFNLRIGTSPGSGNILSSHANDSTGYRKIAKMGSIQDTAYTLNLPLGNYYWSVQAIDAGFKGGAWAAEQSFSVFDTATLCQGNSAVLTAASTVPGATYQWLLNGTPIAGATNAAYPATTTGSYTVITTSGSVSDTSAATIVTVKPVPVTPTVMAVGATTFCTGGSVNLTAASATTGATYQWFNNNTAIAGATSATYTADTTGSYTVVAMANGCSSTPSIATTVTLIPPVAIPTITASSTSLNVGGSVTLTAASASANATFQWFHNGTAIAGATLAGYTATTAGTYTVVATATGCPSDPSAATIITVNPIPATPTITQNGNTLTSSSPAGNQWYLNGIAIPGATGQTYVAVANGAYTLRVTINGYTSAFSAAVHVTNIGISSALAGKSVEVYPNPASGSFYIKLNGYQKEVQVVLYNLAGQQIAKLKATADDKVQKNDIKGLAAGTYLLKVISDKEVQVFRLIVQ